jgi:hypothetical protein
MLSDISSDIAPKNDAEGREGTETDEKNRESVIE